MFLPEWGGDGLINGGFAVSPLEMAADMCSCGYAYAYAHAYAYAYAYAYGYACTFVLN